MNHTEGYNMKKLYLAALLIFLTLPAFSQEDEYARFQGIWYPVLVEYTDEEFYTSEECLIFIDDIFITTLDGDFISGRYSVGNDNLILTNLRALVDEEWTEAEEENETGITVIIQYVFSGDRLMLVLGNDPITFSRYYKPYHPKWSY
jgi:hypothetical protein